MSKGNNKKPGGQDKAKDQFTVQGGTGDEQAAGESLCQEAWTLASSPAAE
jgi:hypothetical protein